MRSLLGNKFWLLFVVISLNTFGQIMFKYVANLIKNDHEPLIICKILITSLPFWLALFSYGGAVFFWLWLLRSTPLSIAYSAISIVFLSVPVMSFYFFHEPIPSKFLLGIFFIGIGVWLTYPNS